MTESLSARKEGRRGKGGREGLRPFGERKGMEGWKSGRFRFSRESGFAEMEG